MRTETSLRHTGWKGGTQIDLQSGAEGPSYDPYHYDEITVTRPDGRWATIHLGLAEWMTYFDGRIERRFDDSCEILRNKFEACVGITPEGAMKAMRKAQDNKIRHHACGYKHLQWVDGYPGETFLHCAKCGSVLDSDFNHEAIK